MNMNAGEMDAKRLSKDRISALPSVLIENILCRLPIRDAVRTSTLSRNWRDNWTTIHKLVFDVYDIFDSSNNKPLAEPCKVISAIHQVLLLHEGPILEFTLFMKANNRSRVEIDQTLLLLSRKNTLEKLEIRFLGLSSYKVPSFVLSLHQLRDLSLCCCKLDLNLALGRLPSLTSLSLVHVTFYKKTLPHTHLNSSFSGLPSLTSIYMHAVIIYRETLEHLISASPLLKRLKLRILWDAELEAQVLDFNFFELFKFFPVIEHLAVNFWSTMNLEMCFKYFAQDAVSRGLPSTLLYLKSLYIGEMEMDCKSQLRGLLLLIRCSPNLEKIKLKLDETETYNPEMNLPEDYSDIWLEHLHELEIKYFTNSKLELEFMKFILTKTPMLKKVRIRLPESLKDNEELKILRILLRCQRASPVAEIIVERLLI